MTYEAQVETGAIRDMLYEMGGKLLFEAPTNPPCPKADPIVIQAWNCKGVSVLLSIRQNSGLWSAFGMTAADNIPGSISHLRKLIEAAQNAKAPK